MESAIVEWVHYDNKLKEYNEKSKILRDHKDKLKDHIFQQMDLGDPGNSQDTSQMPQFNIETLGTQVKIHPTKSYESLNYKFLTGCLREYFDSEEKTKEVLKFIQNKRKVSTTFSIKRDVLEPS